MKLIDILARELKEWPSRASHACSYFWGGKAHVSFTKDGPPAADPHDKECHTWTTLGDARETNATWVLSSGLTISMVPEDRKTAIVTRAQWQAAVEELRDPLPPLKSTLRMPNVMPPKQETIDWGRAPDWAGAVIKNPSNDYYWVSQFGGISCRQRVGAIEPDDTSACMSENSLWSLVSERPSSPWCGEGLPTVGTVCEWDGCTLAPEDPEDPDLHVGDKVRIIAHLKDGQLDLAAFTFDPRIHNPDRGTVWVSQGAHGCFRPIRTPEQIAAEEREKSIRAIEDVISCTVNRDFSRETAEALYEAGYRKQVQP